jgi:hypothetical protein
LFLPLGASNTISIGASNTISNAIYRLHQFLVPTTMTSLSSETRLGLPVPVVHFYCPAPQAVFVYATLNNVILPPKFTPTQNSSNQIPIPPKLVQNLMPDGVAAIFHISHHCDYDITLLPGQGNFEYTSPHTGHVMLSNNL